MSYTDYDPVFVEAERYQANALQVELDEGEHFGDDWVLTPDKPMLARCRHVVDSQPRLEVLEALIYALRGSYHLKPVHDLLTAITHRTIAEWLSGDRTKTHRSILRQGGQAYRYGAQSADLEFLLRICDEPTLEAQGDGDEEDLRGYWFEALAKLKEPRVAEFARSLITADVDRWTDYRMIDALRILGKVGNPSDIALCGRAAKEHPDSYIRQAAKRIVNRHITKTSTDLAGHIKASDASVRSTDVRRMESRRRWVVRL